MHTTFWLENEGTRPLGRPRRRWKHNVTVDLMEIGWGGGVDWIRLTQNKDKWRCLVKTVMNFGYHKRRGIS
jgi:hypothetical protein